MGLEKYENPYKVEVLPFVDLMDNLIKWTIRVMPNKDESYKMDIPDLKICVDANNKQNIEISIQKARLFIKDYKGNDIKPKEVNIKYEDFFPKEVILKL